MSDEVFRQGERLTAAKLNRLLSTGGSTVSGNVDAGNVTGLNEAIDDRVAALLVAGDNITLTYNDAGDSLTIAGEDGGLLDIGSTRTNDYTLALGDADFIPTGAAGAIVVTVPPNADVAWPIGRQVTIQRVGAGAVSIAAGSGVTVNRPAGTDATARDQYSTISLVKTATNQWELFGDLTPSTAAAAAGAVTASGLTMATARLLGRTTASTGAIEEITVGSGLSLSGGSLTATGGSGALSGLSDVSLSSPAIYQVLRYNGSAWVNKYSPAMVRCLRSANLSCSNNTWTLVTWDTEAYDDEGAHSTSSNSSRIVIPSGYTRARFMACANWANNSSGNRLISLEKNAAGVQGAGSGESGGNAIRAANESPSRADTGIMDVTAGDYYEVFVLQDSGGALNLIGPNAFGGRSWFQAEFWP